MSGASVASRAWAFGLLAAFAIAFGALALTLPGSVEGRSTAICAARSFTGLSVDRTAPFPQNGIAYSVPAHVDSTNGPAIAAVARAACSLPRFPAGRYSCPADFGTSYRLTFTSGRDIVGTIEARPAGCARVTGLGAPRQAQSIFWRDLAVALNLPVPRVYCDPFCGQPPMTRTDAGPTR